MYGKPPEQCSPYQCDLGRKTGIIFVPTPIADRGQKDDTRSRNRKHHLAANEEADGTSKRRNSECADPRWRTRGPLAFAALPLSANQQTDPKCDCEFQDNGIKNVLASSVKAPQGPSAKYHTHGLRGSHRTLLASLNSTSFRAVSQCRLGRDQQK